jgi:hypothetical protein
LDYGREYLSHRGPSRGRCGQLNRGDGGSTGRGSDRGSKRECYLHKRNRQQAFLEAAVARWWDALDVHPGARRGNEAIVGQEQRPREPPERTT